MPLHYMHFFQIFPQSLYIYIAQSTNKWIKMLNEATKYPPIDVEEIITFGIMLFYRITNIQSYVIIGQLNKSWETGA